MSTPLAVQAQGLGVRLAGRQVLRGLDLSVTVGRWTCVVGPNGAGKSTLFKALAGLLPVQGEVSWSGRPLPTWQRRARARHLAWLGQGQSAPEDLSVQDVAMLGRLPHQGWQAQATPQDHDAVQQALCATDMLALRAQPLGRLSAGERQRALQARALAVQAPVLFMDEPLAHLDPPHQARWWALVRELVAQGRTVVTVLHELSLAMQADELLVMQSGCLLHQGPPSHGATREAVEEVFGQSVSLRQFEGQWLALPRLAPT